MGHVGGVKDEKEEKDKKEEKEEKEKIKRRGGIRKKVGKKRENQRKTKTTQKIEGRETENREEGRELFLGISSTEIHRARRLSQALSPLFFFSLWTFYFAVNTDLVMDLCSEILRFIILAMS